jgi:hypothetical protein
MALTLEGPASANFCPLISVSQFAGALDFSGRLHSRALYVASLISLLAVD